MKAECYACLFQQSLRVVQAGNYDEKTKVSAMKTAAGTLSALKSAQTPPEAASVLYPMLSDILKNPDPYAEQKKLSIRAAKNLISYAEKHIKNSENTIDAALRAAVAGNVIDFATEKSFDLDEEFDTIFSAAFSIDHKAELISRLNESKNLVIIGDNVGEHLFDALLVETLAANFPHLRISYFTRGVEIINDIVATDALEAGIDRYAKVVDSGVDTPGFLYGRASREARRHYDEADLILAKGMGNFECLESEADPRIYFLFKVKCSVVAGHIDRKIGDLICMKIGQK